jgi:hypothetical protein
MDAETISVLVEIQSTLSRIERMLENTNQQSSIGIEGDLIELFFNELALYQIDFDEKRADFDLDDVKNKASYYFNNQGKITNKRAYLLKLVSQIHSGRRRNPERISVSFKVNDSMTDFDMDMVSRFEELTLINLQSLRQRYAGLSMLLNGRSFSDLLPLHKAAFVHYALKDGILTSQLQVSALT